MISKNGQTSQITSPPQSISYTRIWKNYDGTVLKTETYTSPLYLSADYEGTLPTRASTTEYDYTFDGWSKSVSGDTTTMTAQFTAVGATRTVVWKSYDGTTLQTSTYAAPNSEPSFTGTIPTKTTTNSHGYPKYSFKGWLKSVSGTLNRNTTYTANVTMDTYYSWTEHVVANEATATAFNYPDWIMVSTRSSTLIDGTYYLQIAALNNKDSFTDLGLESYAGIRLNAYQVASASESWSMSFGKMVFSGTPTWTSLATQALYRPGNYASGTSIQHNYGWWMTAGVEDVNRPVYIWLSSTSDYGTIIPWAMRYTNASFSYNGTSCGVQYTLIPHPTCGSQRIVLDDRDWYQGHYAYAKAVYQGDHTWKIYVYVRVPNTGTSAGLQVRSVFAETNSFSGFHDRLYANAITHNDEGSIINSIVYKNSSGTILQAAQTYEMGTAMPTYSGTTPTKAADANYSYEFSGWDRTTTVDSRGAETHTMVARFNAVSVWTVKWVVEGVTKQTSTFYEGEAEPTYTGATPTKASTSTYTYTFSSWSKSTSGKVITYTAQFTSTRYYTWERYNVVTTPGSYTSTTVNDYKGTRFRNIVITNNSSIEVFVVTADSISNLGSPSVNKTTGEITVTLYGSTNSRFSVPAGEVDTSSGGDFFDTSEYDIGQYAICGDGGGRTGPWPGGKFTVSSCVVSSNDLCITIVDSSYTECWHGFIDKNGSRYYDLDLVGIRATGSGTTYSKGTTKYSNVTSTSSTAYPSDGYKGSYWYVKIS